MHQPTYIPIYRDNKLSRWESLKPQIHAKILLYGSKIDYWFVSQGKWPTDEELLGGDARRAAAKEYIAGIQ